MYVILQFTNNQGLICSLLPFISSLGLLLSESLCINFMEKKILVQNVIGHTSRIWEYPAYSFVKINICPCDSASLLFFPHQINVKNIFNLNDLFLLADLVQNIWLYLKGKRVHIDTFDKNATFCNVLCFCLFVVVVIFIYLFLIFVKS